MAALMSVGSDRAVRTLLAGLSLTILFAAPAKVAAQQMDVPANLQYSLITRILAFDRALRDRAHDSVVVAIAYQNGHRPSRGAMEALTAAIHGSTEREVHGLRVVAVSVEYESREQLEKVLAETDPTVLYITPMRAVDVGEMTSLAGRHGVPTISGVSDYVRHGVGVVISLKGGKPHIILNLKAARRSGAQYGSQLLQLVEVIQ